MRRRTLLGLPTLGAAAIGLSACGGGGATPGDDGPGDDGSVSSSPGGAHPQTIRYGEDPSQFGELTRPPGASRGVVVVIHGGFWRAEYDLSLGRPLAADLAARGWTAWNIEYRRVGGGAGGGGGVPQTLDDVRAAIGTLAGPAVGRRLDLTRLITLGHSAGGHLSAWAGGQVAGVTHAISQAGVLDLVTADRGDLGGGAVAAFLGHHASAADAEADPFQQIPISVPVWCVHDDQDTIVPISQSEDYVTAAKAAGATASFVRVSGDHFVLIDPSSAAWRAQLEILDSIG